MIAASRRFTDLVGIALILPIAARSASGQDWLNTNVPDFQTVDRAQYETNSAEQDYGWSAVQDESQPEMDLRDETAAASACDLPTALLSSVYFRVDSFVWIETVGNYKVVEEHGPLFTLGLEQSLGRTRLRGELFGGQVDHEAYPGDGLISGTADYIGVRGEFDVLFQPDSFPRSNLIAGVGTRYWNRHLHDGVYKHNGHSHRLDDVDEDWWTIYPYIGIETKKQEHADWRFYGSARLGLTAFTLVNHSYADLVFNPTPGITGQFEVGVSNNDSSIGLYYEVITWGESDVVQSHFQPESGMGFLGLKLGLLY